MTPAPDATSPASQVGMEGEARNETLIERLEGMADEFAKVRPHIGSDGPTETLLRESARAIRDLEAENARLRSAPIPAVQSGAVAWAYRYPDHGGGTVLRFETGGREINGARPVEAFPLYAAPQSEPLPGGGEEAEKQLRFMAGNLRDVVGTEDFHIMFHERIEVADNIDAILAALSGKEQG